jgi:uncharacterized protein YeaO (DUF488 family)
MIRTFAGELRAEGLDRAEIVQGAHEHLSRLNHIGGTVFSRWAGLIPTTHDAAPAIKIKRVYETPAPSDGVRFLVDRLWPRGLKKEVLRGGVWAKEVAPSDALRCWYGHDPKKWEEFRRRYFVELDGKRATWEPILKMARRVNVVLLYSAHDTEHSNAVALRDYLTAKLQKR